MRKKYDLPCVIMSALPPIELPRGDSPVLTNAYLTFGVFNRITKVSDDAVAAWARVLHGVPGARLLMKDGAYDEPQMRDLMRQRFVAHGIAGERIDFLGPSPREQHLAAFGKTDIALDPFSQNGGVSTWEVAQLGHTAPAASRARSSPRSAWAIGSAKAPKATSRSR